MARSPATGAGSQPEATTLIFPKKSIWEDLAKTKRETKKRAQSQSGIYGAAVKDAVEKEHVDRKALAIVLKLEGMDDEDLHVTVFHIIDGMKKLGILKRAMAQEEMFDEHKVDIDAVAGVKAAKAAKAAPKNGNGKNGKAAKPPKTPKKASPGLVPIGEAAREVAEAAGEAVKH